MHRRCRANYFSYIGNFQTFLYYSNLPGSGGIEKGLLENGPAKSNENKL